MTAKELANLIDGRQYLEEMTQEEERLAKENGLVVVFGYSDDNPKKMSEFHKQCTPKCDFSEECGGTTQRNCLFALSRPPQSWCYVEEAEDE